MSRAVYSLADREKSILKVIKKIENSSHKHPMVLEAAQKLGISMNELQPLQFEDFQKDEVDEHTQKIEFDKFESLRVAKLRLIAHFILENSSPTHQKAESLSISSLNSPYRDSNGRKLQVEFNKRKIAKLQAQRIKKIKEHTFSPRKVNEEMLQREEERKLKNQERDLKIKQIKQNKTIQIRDTELSALRAQFYPSHSVESSVPPKQTSNSLYTDDIEPEELSDIEEILDSLDDRINSSNIRHQEFLRSKVSGQCLRELSALKLRMRRKELKSAENKEWRDIVLEIKHRTETYKTRRLLKLEEERQRISETLKGSLNRHRVFSNKSPQVKLTNRNIDTIREKALAEKAKKATESMQKYKDRKSRVDYIKSKQQIIETAKKEKILGKVYSQSTN